MYTDTGTTCMMSMSSRHLKFCKVDHKQTYKFRMRYSTYICTADSLVTLILQPTISNHFKMVCDTELFKARI
jgi:hypothetical protein